MKKNILLTLLFAVVTLFLFQVSSVFAVTCTQNGSTAYCTDTSTGRTTTYTQYGNNIYGSDGTTYTTYGNSTYGSGNIFRAGGSSGSSLPGVSASSADLNSPEVKAAKAKLDESCAKTPSASGEVIIGGTQATNCRNATAEWLLVLSEVQKNHASSNNNDSDDDYSDSNDESLDEWTKKLLSDFGITNDSSQSVNSCVSMGFPNSHQEGNKCFCDIGYTQSDNKCVPLSIQSCEALHGPGAVPWPGTNGCRCDTSYTTNANYNFSSGSRNACLSSSANTAVTPPPTFTPINFEVQSEDILISFNKIGNTNTEVVLRQCPSVQCSKTGSYPKGTPVEIVGEYKKDTWLKVKVLTDLKTGWMHQSLVDDAVIKQAELENNTSEPVRMTRAEYEAKYGVFPPTEVETRTEVKKTSWFRNLFIWFGL